MYIPELITYIFGYFDWLLFLYLLYMYYEHTKNLLVKNDKIFGKWWKL